VRNDVEAVDPSEGLQVETTGLLGIGTEEPPAKRRVDEGGSASIDRGVGASDTEDPIPH
jgi:hypothetical protein